VAGPGGGAQRGVLEHGSPGPEQGGRLVAALEGKADEPQWLDELLEHKSLADGLPGWSWGLSSLGQSSTNDGGRWSILRWLSLTRTHHGQSPCWRKALEGSCAREDSSALEGLLLKVDIPMRRTAGIEVRRLAR
jgi:hypothetical protein